jgi:hypothetical protein
MLSKQRIFVPRLKETGMNEIRCRSITIDVQQIWTILPALLLRADLHIAFDKPDFVFVPKPAEDSREFVIHVIEPLQELESLYHNRELQSIQVSLEMLFTRFAWTIFPLLADFLVGPPRWLRLTTTIDDDMGNEMSSLVLAPTEQSKEFLRQARNSTGRKRKRDEDATEEAECLAEEEDATEETESLGEEEEATEEANSLHEKEDATEAKSLGEEEDATEEAKSLHGKEDATEAKSLHQEGQQQPQNHHQDSRESSHGSLLSEREIQALYKRLIPLQQEWIERERKRSDRDKSWEKEMAWAKRVYDNKILLGRHNAKRWLEYNGEEEVQDELPETGPYP